MIKDQLPSVLGGLNEPVTQQIQQELSHQGLTHNDLPESEAPSTEDPDVHGARRGGGGRGGKGRKGGKVMNPGSRGGKFYKTKSGGIKYGKKPAKKYKKMGDARTIGQGVKGMQKAKKIRKSTGTTGGKGYMPAKKRAAPGGKTKLKTSGSRKPGWRDAEAKAKSSGSTASAKTVKGSKPKRDFKAEQVANKKKVAGLNIKIDKTFEAAGKASRSGNRKLAEKLYRKADDMDKEIVWLTEGLRL